MKRFRVLRENNCRHSEGCLSERGLDLFDGLRGLDHAISHKEADPRDCRSCCLPQKYSFRAQRFADFHCAAKSRIRDHVMGSVIYVLAQDDRIFSFEGF